MSIDTEMDMPRLRQRLTYQAAIELLATHGISDPLWGAAGRAPTSINIGDDGIDADKGGFFKRSDVCRLVGYAKTERAQS